jgi:hypothetical protein
VRLPEIKQNAVFLNIPYDNGFRSLYLAYIVGLTHLGLEPKATLGIPGGERRLDRILELIQSCRYSIHDLSRVEVDRKPPYSTPRFNMPFELGLAVAWSKLHPQKHDWIVCETVRRRIQKSLSDLDGTDPNIHEGTVRGVMRELCNAFVRKSGPRPTVPAMMKTYEIVNSRTKAIRLAAGATSLFESRVFDDLCFAAKVAAEE